MPCAKVSCEKQSLRGKQSPCERPRAAVGSALLVKYTRSTRGERFRGAAAFLSLLTSWLPSVESSVFLSLLNAQRPIGVNLSRGEMK